MRCPRHLTGHAREFWQTHAPQLLSDGRLTTDTAPAFELLCANWAVIRTLDPAAGGRDAITWMASQKQFTALSKQFQMTPAAKGHKAPEPEQEVDEYGLPI